MNSILFCLCLSIAPGARPADPWLAEDKLKHFFASFAATTLSASAARTAGADQGTSVVFGSAAGVGFSVWKEVQDHRRPGGFFSYRDLVWDMAGVGAGAALLRQTR